MPHIPKQPLRTASTSSPIPPELQLPRLPDRPSIRQGTGRGQQQRPPAAGKIRVTGPRISPLTFEFDTADVFKALFGKEASTNELTGLSNVVSPRHSGISTAG